MRIPDAEHLHNTIVRIIVSLLAAMLALAVLASTTAGAQAAPVKQQSERGAALRAGVAAGGRDADGVEVLIGVAHCVLPAAH